MVNFDEFSVGADHDGAMDLDHDIAGKWCQRSEAITRNGVTIAELIKLAEEHLKVCPLRVIES